MGDLFDYSYIYNDQTIHHYADGLVFANGMEFVSTADAEEWLETSNEDAPVSNVLHSYKVVFIPPHGLTKNSVVVPNCIDDADAIDWVQNSYCRDAEILDVYNWD